MVYNRIASPNAEWDMEDEDDRLYSVFCAQRNKKGRRNTTRLRRAILGAVGIMAKKKTKSKSKKPTPTKPALWSKAKAEAKRKFKVHPSAYANALCGEDIKQWAAAGDNETCLPPVRVSGGGGGQKAGQ